MSEVKRYWVPTNTLADQSGWHQDDTCVVQDWAYDRVVGERDALHLRLNEADQRIDELVAALTRIHERCEIFADDDRDMRVASVEVMRDIAARALPASAESCTPIVRDERAEFEAWLRGEWPSAPISRVRDLLPKNDPCYGDYCDDYLQRAWVGWQARAALVRKSR